MVPPPMPRVRVSVRSVGVALVACLALVLGLAVAAPANASTGSAATSTVSTAPAVASGGQPQPTGLVKTADLSKFQPGNIITDALFFNSGTMTEAQIQTFLQGKVPSCQAGYTCLKDWYDTSRATTADAMCGAYAGGTRERASTIIYKVAQACGINPQVILATLEKEQGLVTHTWPSEFRYTIAMGQGCPDTAACDTKYYGFFNQVYGAAWQFKRYANPPGTSQYFTWYAPGNTWNIRWSPDASCGSSPVYIQNQATANLYYYTPYQPNAASLAAGRGTGDACSTYGNRNFYNNFTDWFGSSQGETMQVLQVTGSGQKYLVSQGARWLLSTPEIAGQYAWISTVRQVSQADIDKYQDRGAAKRAVRTETGVVYLLDSGQRLRLINVAQVTDFGWDYGALPLASEAQVGRYRDGGWLQRVVRSSGQSWLIQSASRRQVLDLSLLPRYGISAASSDISAAMTAEYKTSVPVVGPGVYSDGAQSYRVQTDAGVYSLPAAATGTAITTGARALTAESIAALTATGTLPVRLSSGGRSFVMVENGWLEVAPREYPATLPFTTLPTGAASGIPSAGTVSGPHFLKEKSAAQVYLVSGGTMQASSAADQAWITRTYGVNPRVWVGVDGTIADGSAPEGLVRTAAGASYLLDGARVYRLTDCNQVAAWGGDCNTLPTITDAKLAGYANAGTLQQLVRTPAGTTWLPQGGKLRQVLDPSVLAVYGIPATTSPVSAATAAKLPVGEPALAAGVYSDGGSKRIDVTEGGEYTLTADQAVGVMQTSARALTADSFARITVEGALPSKMRSDGRAFVLTQEGWLEVPSASYGGDAVFGALPSRAWTGIPIAANETRPHFVRDAAGQEYLISGGAAQPVSGAAERATITATYGVPPKVWVLAGGALSGVRISYDLVVKGASGEVYLIDGDTRYRMSGCGAAADFGKDCATLKPVTAAQVASMKDGGTLAALLRSADGTLWLPQSGAKREVPDPRLLSAYGIGSSSTAVSAALLAQLPLGQPVVGVGVYDDRAGDVRVITGDGRKFALPAAVRIGTVTSAAWRLSPASIDLITTEGDLPTRINTGSQAYLLTSEGWLAVNASDYAPLAFSAIGARAAEGIPSAGAEPRPHFVREQSASNVLLASGGLSAAGDEAGRAWITATYGVPPKVWVVPDGTLR